MTIKGRIHGASPIVSNIICWHMETSAPCGGLSQLGFLWNNYLKLGSIKLASRRFVGMIPDSVTLTTTHYSGSARQPGHQDTRVLPFAIDRLATKPLILWPPVNSRLL